MNSDLALKVENLHKIYRLGTKDQQSENVVGAVTSFLRAPIRNYKKYRSLYDFSDIDTNSVGKDSILRALNGVSFDVKAGEVVGIIGVNGAGKSTLLKVLSRITSPTIGKLTIRGRVSSLLEVGTGFHPELTGRENIYLNGTILGMKKKEIDQRYDEIVDFAGVDDFLETPVKRYSSGMRVRLAFSVAAHLEPEILIVDEVLAVGDAQFQKKCLDKMQSVGEDGRTVLFVSHSMPAISRMCTRCILLNAGQIIKDGPVNEVVPMYLQSGGSGAEYEWEAGDSPGTDIVRLLAVRILDESMQACPGANIEQQVNVSIEYEVFEGGHVFMPVFALENDQGVLVFVAVDQDKEWVGRPRPTGIYQSIAQIPGNLLSEGMLSVNVSMWAMEPKRILQFKTEGMVAFQVVDKMTGTSSRGQWIGDMPGVVRPKFEWRTSHKA